jgi:hypothetical protein
MLREWNVLDHEHSALSMPATVSRLALLHSVNVFGSGILDRVWATLKSSTPAIWFGVRRIARA